MTATTPIRPARSLIVDPIDYVLVDIATGRLLPGDGVHAEQLAHEHGLDTADAAAAIDSAWHLGLVSRHGMAGGGTVAWCPEASQVHLHRLACAMVAAVAAGPRGRGTVGLIDGEQARIGAVELFGLTTPCDVELFLELGRALLGSCAPALVDELVVPIAVLFSEAAQSVHGLELAAPPEVRRDIACDLVRCLMDGRPGDFAGLVDDYLLALSIA